jgi:hypothetical protein
MGLILWVVDAALFFLIAWRFSDRNIHTGLLGLVLGIVCRLVITCGMACLITAHLGQAAPATFFAMERVLWVYHLLATLTVAVLYVVPLRPLFRGRDGQTAANGSKSSAAQFSFQTASRVPTTSPEVIRAAPKKPEATSQLLMPPDGFTAVVPMEGVLGLVNVPLEVITASVPEAVDVLQAEMPVRIRLAFIIPQLRNATIWLTWEQIFSDGPEDPNLRQGPGRVAPHLSGRWVRIPAQYYVPQVPPDYFVKPSGVTPLWMKRPPAPQEAQFVDA